MRDQPEDLTAAHAELDEARAARLRAMRALTMEERLSRVQQLCVEAAKVSPAKPAR